MQTPCQETNDSKTMPTMPSQIAAIAHNDTTQAHTQNIGGAGRAVQDKQRWHVQ